MWPTVFVVTVFMYSKKVARLSQISAHSWDDALGSYQVRPLTPLFEISFCFKISLRHLAYGLRAPKSLSTCMTQSFCPISVQTMPARSSNASLGISYANLSVVLLCKSQVVKHHHCHRKQCAFTIYCHQCCAQHEENFRVWLWFVQCNCKHNSSPVIIGLHIYTKQIHKGIKKIGKFHLTPKTFIYCCQNLLNGQQLARRVPYPI